MKTVCFVRTGVQSMRGMAPFGLMAFGFLFACCAFGQASAEPDSLDTGGLHNLTPVARVLRTMLWSFAGILLLIAAVVTVLRRRVSPSLYQSATDEQWQEDAGEEAAAQVTEDEVVEACEDFGKPSSADDDAKPTTPQTPPPKQSRLYTPASGPAWDEPMLNAFLGSCLKANSLTRPWRDEAARRQQVQKTSARLPDPREAEFIRKLKVRWQEFHVDPENGIFIEHVIGSSGPSRLCIIRVSRQKHTVTRAELNAGFVLETVGRYLKSSDLAYPAEPACYQVPSAHELAAMSVEEKKRLLQLKQIPEPWQAMVA